MSKLSIIIPVYNVELYLEECLDSLLVQKLDDYEVIMVDDGSTDSSLMIMNKYAGKYEKFKSYTKKNSGLGHTRNYGISVSSGDYITFLDSDDIIPPSAYKTMKDTLDKTNSDFLTGNVIRFNSEKEFPSSLHQKIFSEDILETTIKNNPELINDTIACNKMYRKTFWDKHDFKFPEDMLFEDIPVTIPSHLSAKSVDVLTMYTYRWRARDFGAASITQQRSEFKNMHDRMKALNMVSEFITTENLNKEIKNQFDLKSLLLDIPIYMNVLLDGDEMFQAYFLESVKSYLENVDCELFKDLRVSNRIKYCLIQQNKKKELLDFLEYYKTLGYLEKPTLINENYYYDYRYKEYLPDELKCAEVEFEPVTRIEEVNWEKKSLI